MNLTEVTGKEIYCVCEAEDTSMGEIYITEDWYELVNYMKTLVPGCDGDTRIFHGVVADAMLLPASLKSKNAFIICQDPKDVKRGLCVDTASDSVEELADFIETLINETKLFGFKEKPFIENVFVLYGYQLRTCMSVDDEEVDEEVIDTCMKIAKELKQMEV